MAFTMTCDKCGKTIKKNNKVMAPYSTVKVREAVKTVHDFRYCEDCTKELLVWLSENSD